MDLAKDVFSAVLIKHRWFGMRLGQAFVNFTIRPQKIPWGVPVIIRGGRYKDKSHCDYYSRVDSATGCVVDFFWSNSSAPKYYGPIVFCIHLSDSKPDLIHQRLQTHPRSFNQRKLLVIWLRRSKCLPTVYLQGYSLQYYCLKNVKP